MADIDVVKKSSSSWLWILIALIVVALIVLFAMSGGSAPETRSELQQIPALGNAVTPGQG